MGSSSKWGELLKAPPGRPYILTFTYAASQDIEAFAPHKDTAEGSKKTVNLYQPLEYYWEAFTLPWVCLNSPALEVSHSEAFRVAAMIRAGRIV